MLILFSTKEMLVEIYQLIFNSSCDSSSFSSPIDAYRQRIIIKMELFGEE